MSLSKFSTRIIFGTDTSNTEEMAGKISEALKAYDNHAEASDIINIELTELESFDLIILGIPTWDFGGIQEDWEEREAEIKALNLEGKFVALYGLGDQFGYADYFVDAMGWLHELILTTKANIIVYWPTEGYDFEASRASLADNSLFCGLALDEDQQIELSEKRIDLWLKQLNEELNCLAIDKDLA